MDFHLYLRQTRNTHTYNHFSFIYTYVSCIVLFKDLSSSSTFYHCFFVFLCVSMYNKIQHSEHFYTKSQKAARLEMQCYFLFEIYIKHIYVFYVKLKSFEKYNNFFSKYISVRLYFENKTRVGTIRKKKYFVLVFLSNKFPFELEFY